LEVLNKDGGKYSQSDISHRRKEKRDAAQSKVTKNRGQVSVETNVRVKWEETCNAGKSAKEEKQDDQVLWRMSGKGVG